MQPLRQIRRRIKSVENTKKMTRAMEMVAAAKLKKLQEMLKQSDRYIAELKRILETLVREKPLAHPLLERRAEVKQVAVFLIASDTGLCGSYNTSVLECANQFLGAETVNAAARFVAIGKHAANYLKRTRRPITKDLGIPRPQEVDEAIHNLAQIATDQFKNGESDRIVFIYTKVASLGSLRPTVAQLFPIVSDKTGTAEENDTHVAGARRGTPLQIDYLIEPSLDDILELMLPEFIEAQVGQFMRHSLVAEQASRMLAMRQATDNAQEMIDSLTLLRNKARQAAITKELIEVVSGSRALQMK